MRYVRGHLRNSRILIQVGIRGFADDPSQISDFTFQEFTALVDTGATRTAISQNVIDRVRLESRGQIEVGNVRRTELHDTFMFYVGVWPDGVGDDPPSFFGIGDEILGIDGGDSRYYDVLLGMDILRRGSLRLELDGTFELAFPS
jgi:hypothetical protein